MTALIAAIVLFVGSFLIVNTLSMTVGERAREVGLLRAAGATRAQIVRFVLAGALAIGVMGSALGLRRRAPARDAHGRLGPRPDRLPGRGRQPRCRAASSSPSSVGVVITIAGAIEPAVRAARISPVEALRARLDLPAGRRARLGWLALVFVAVAVLALLVWPPAAGATGADRALAVYAVLLAATLATPFLLPPLARLLGSPLAAVLRLEERLARGSLARDRSRAALTLGALVVGLAMIVALGWTAQAARNAATAWLADVVPGRRGGDLDPAGRAGRGSREIARGGARRPLGHPDRDVRPRDPGNPLRRGGGRRRRHARRRAARLHRGRSRRRPPGARRGRRRDPAETAADAARGRRRATRSRSRSAAGRRSTCGSPGSSSGPSRVAAARRSSSAGRTRRSGSGSRGPTPSRSGSRPVPAARPGPPSRRPRGASPSRPSRCRASRAR